MLLLLAENKVVLESIESGTRMVNWHSLGTHIYDGSVMIEMNAMFLSVNEMSRARPIFATLFWIGLIGLVLTVANVFFYQREMDVNLFWIGNNWIQQSKKQRLIIVCINKMIAVITVN